MANRYIPFGYEIIDGLIKIVERETEVVRSVYALYIQGLSLIEIANRLNMLPIIKNITPTLVGISPEQIIKLLNEIKNK